MSNGRVKPNNGNALALVGDKKNLTKILESPRFTDMVKQVASKYLSAEKIVKICLLAHSRQPQLQNCTLESFLQGAVKAAELGLDFAGQTGQGYLIPYGNKNLPAGVKECQFQPGYQGFIELAYRSKQVTYIDSQLVYAKDKCDYGLGSTPFVTHKPYLGSDRGKVLFGYVVVRLIGADIPKVEIMTYTDIMRIKARSKSSDSGPWKTDEPEMMRKTVVRRAWKYIPKTPEMLEAIEQDNRDYDLTSNQIAESVNGIGPEGLKERYAQKNGAKKVENTEVEKPPTEQPIDPEKAKEKAENIKRMKEADKKAKAAKAKEDAEKFKSEPEPPKPKRLFHCNDCGLDFAPEDIEANDNCPKCLSQNIKK